MDGILNVYWHNRNFVQPFLEYKEKTLVYDKTFCGNIVSRSINKNKNILGQSCCPSYEGVNIFLSWKNKLLYKLLK